MQRTGKLLRGQTVVFDEITVYIEVKWPTRTERGMPPGTWSGSFIVPEAKFLELGTYSLVLENGFTREIVLQTDYNCEEGDTVPFPGTDEPPDEG